jgi:hypothetical protein
MLLLLATQGDKILVIQTALEVRNIVAMRDVHLPLPL